VYLNETHRLFSAQGKSVFWTIVFWQNKGSMIFKGDAIPLSTIPLAVQLAQQGCV
jgi:hypothetical protein